MFQGSVENSRRLMIAQLILALVALFFVNFSVYYCIWVFVFYAMTLWIAHHAGLHRYFAHRSYSVNKFWHAVLCIVSCLVCFGSPAGYAATHRAHHIHADTAQDPHSQAHIGIFNIVFFNWNLSSVSLWAVTKDLRDQWLRFSHNYYMAIVMVFYAALLAVDPALALCYSLGTVLSLFAMGFVNTVCHSRAISTYRNFKCRDTSSNSYFAILIGEWHNNHHANPQQWNQRVQWWEIDPAAQFIKLIKNAE